MTRPIRVLVVDDSSFMRQLIARVLARDDAFEVVGEARDGREAVGMVEELRPDVVTMDFNMPQMDGAAATREILRQRSVGVVMLSAHTSEGAAQTVAALTAGAFDFVQKPGGEEVSASLHAVEDELRDKLRAAARANVAVLASGGASSERALGSSPRVARSSPRAARSSPRASSPRATDDLPASKRPMPPGLRVVVLAASTGGPAALARIVPKLPTDNVAVLVVQHMPVRFTAALAGQLAEGSTFDVREVQGGEELVAGGVWVARGGKHLVVTRSGMLDLVESEPVHGVRPAADVTLKSVAETFGARSVGVVLTGMGRDGALGLAAVKAAGGRTVAQDEATSVVYGMPRAAVAMGVVDEVVSLGDVPNAVERLVK